MKKLEIIKGKGALNKNPTTPKNPYIEMD